MSRRLTRDDIKRVHSRIAEALFKEKGLMTIKGAEIEEVMEVSDTIVVKGSITVEVPSKAVRAKILEILRG